MIDSAFPYRIIPIGDSSLLVDYGNVIDEAVNAEVLLRFRQLQQHPLKGMREVVPAYSSLSIYYDVFQLRKMVPEKTTVFDWIKNELEQRLQQPALQTEESHKLVRIPVCYDESVAPELPAICASINISKEELVALHTGRQYRVYMLGFLPGFAYLGQTDERIALPRKSQPHLIKAGSIGIAGRQTGIYPLTSPGGWQVIGRTPKAILQKTEENNLTLLQAGDIVEFYPITSDEFESH